MQQIARSNEIVDNQYAHQGIDDGSPPQKIAKYNKNKHKQINPRVLVHKRYLLVFKYLP